MLRHGRGHSWPQPGAQHCAGLLAHCGRVCGTQALVPLGLVPELPMLRPADILTSAALDGCTAALDVGITASGASETDADPAETMHNKKARERLPIQDPGGAEHPLRPHRTDVLRATPRGGQGGLAAHRSPSGAAPRGRVCPGRATAHAPGHRHRARPPGGTHEPRELADDVAPSRRQRFGPRRRLSGARSPLFSEPRLAPTTRQQFVKTMCASSLDSGCGRLPDVGSNLTALRELVRARFRPVRLCSPWRWGRAWVPHQYTLPMRSSAPG